ncbi:hypothetical protein JCM10369A_38410 [Nocardioides pyridinolyticus]
MLHVAPVASPGGTGAVCIVEGVGLLVGQATLGHPASLNVDDDLDPPRCHATGDENLLGLPKESNLRSIGAGIRPQAEGSRSEESVICAANGLRDGRLLEHLQPRLLASEAPWERDTTG